MTSKMKQQVKTLPQQQAANAETPSQQPPGTAQAWIKQGKIERERERQYQEEQARREEERRRKQDEKIREI